VTVAAGYVTSREGGPSIPESHCAAIVPRIVTIC
jgi:hypothetical protein